MGNQTSAASTAELHPNRARQSPLVGRWGLAGKPSEPNDKNPLYLSVSERYASLFCLLEVDGDLLTPMYRRLLQVGTFTRSTAGEMAAEALEELRGRASRMQASAHYNKLGEDR